ncbi:hypothetical protein ANN_13366 [Periplaneta americana]|uniref:Uncharacterized protein n=1 Tax=Periplaneta americana TaxID=6978 RepID=A0ABQ8TJP3_PERAM|nr:hypothetical protein ANN_13366 [Periplaneta americana]
MSINSSTERETIATETQECAIAVRDKDTAKIQASSAQTPPDVEQRSQTVKRLIVFPTVAELKRQSARCSSVLYAVCLLILVAGMDMERRFNRCREDRENRGNRRRTREKYEKNAKTKRERGRQKEQREHKDKKEKTRRTKEDKEYKMRLREKQVDRRKHKENKVTTRKTREIQGFSPRSPDLIPPDFYLWGALKDTVYATKPQTLEELRVQIEHARNNIPLATIQLFKVCHGSLYAVMWLADEPREFILPTLPQRRITYVPEKLPGKYGVRSEEYLPICTVTPVLAGM